MRKPKTGRAILGAFAVAILLKIFLFDFMITEGRSMLPAIKPGSVLFVWKIAYGFKLPWTEDYLVQWAEPKKGDVIVFYTPQGVTAVKRCAGITGNHRFIALGDNRDVSFDSISYGPVLVTHIIGKVLGTKGKEVERQ
jgi:signal peptidase I